MVEHVLAKDETGVRFSLAAQFCLIFFKNHSDFKWEGVDDVIAIAGLNGAGKTSILDAIHFLCVGKSYFTATDLQCIQNDALQSGIIAKLQTEKLTDLKIKLKRMIHLMQLYIHQNIIDYILLIKIIMN